MPANYAFELNMDLRTPITKTLAMIFYTSRFQASDGKRWIALAHSAANNAGLLQISGTDGIVQDQATITANTEITKTVGTAPQSIDQFQASDGKRWIVTGDSSSTQVSIFQIAGTDGIVQNQATITANTAITKTVGSNPQGAHQFQSSDGKRWIVVADKNSSTVSIFQIAGTDGIVQDQATITANTRITKAMGAGPGHVTTFTATDGRIWVAAVTSVMALFQIAGTDGIVQDQATITANTLITKAVGTTPNFVAQVQATDGSIWILTSDGGSSQVSLIQVAGTDGIIDDQATITAFTNRTKSTGTSSTPRAITVFQVTDGSIWVAAGCYSSAKLAWFQIASASGTIDDQTTLTANALTTKSAAGQPFGVSQFQSSDYKRWLVLGNVGGTIVLVQIAGVNDRAFPPNILSNVNVTNTESLVTAPNLAEVASSLDYFNFGAGVSPMPFAVFAYTYTFDDAGTIGSGSALRLTTATADITNSSGITVASGATVRLGKKAAYTIDFTFQNGSTLEVFPDSDRSGATLDLTNCTFAATTTVNATSGAATVLVPLGSAANITAGAGVTIQEPVAATSVTGLIAGSRVQIYNVTTASEIFNDVVAGTSHTDSYTLDDGDVLRLRVAKLGYEDYEVGAVYSASTGASWLVSQVANAIYDANGIDGSTITKFVADYANEQVDLQVAADFTAAEFYAWWCYNMTTEDGIANFYGGITALDQANYRINNAVVDVLFDNLTTSNKKQSDSARIFRDDGTYPVYDPTTGGGGVQVNWQIPVYVVGTASALTPSESAKLMGLDTAAIRNLVEADEVHTPTTVEKRLRGTATVLLTKNHSGVPLSTFEAVQ